MTYDLSRPDESVLYCITGIVRNHLVVLGMISDAKNVKGVKRELRLGLEYLGIGGDAEGDCGEVQRAKGTGLVGASQGLCVRGGW
ncbi:hypothetical protein SESBI_42183 [Sesbania bispinosa]|nr:hypothetical protein SESBI_42183 [Sesbania bispinosa]